jgi:hypothetical protein
VTSEQPSQANAEQADDAFDVLWARVLEAWEDDRTHAALREYAVRTQRLPEAARRYKAMKSDPARAELAQKRLDAIVLAATQMMFAMRTPPRGRIPLGIILSVLGICASVLAWVALLVMRR